MIKVTLSTPKDDYIQKGVSIKIPMAYNDLECAFVQKHLLDLPHKSDLNKYDKINSNKGDIWFYLNSS